MAGRTRGGDKGARHEIAPTIRYSFLKALDLLGTREGKTLPQIMLDAIDEHGLMQVMDKVAKFQERTSDVNLKGDLRLVDILAGIASREQDSELESESEPVRH